jgi:hypothetical protein
MVDARLTLSGAGALSVATNLTAVARPDADHDAVHSHSHRWVKGQFGNPRGKISVTKRTDELFAAIIADFGAPDLNALHREYARQAARQLARASITKDDALAVRLSNGAAKLIGLIHQGRANHKFMQPVGSAFDEYVKQRNVEAER